MPDYSHGSAATASGRPASPSISSTAGSSSTLSRWRRTRARARPSFTTAATTRSRSTRSSASFFKKRHRSHEQSSRVIMSEQFPCLGLSILGLCSYNPAQPTPVYFTLGNAIAALALTLAVQQLLKPIYIFRLRAYRLKIIYFVFLVFLGFACAVVAMLLPNLP